MRLDLDIPEKYGIYQSVGDTVGPGGLSRALRNVPVMVDIAQAMERRCPNAWMLNLTNPLTVLTRVVAHDDAHQGDGPVPRAVRRARRADPHVRRRRQRLRDARRRRQSPDLAAGHDHPRPDGLQMVRDFVAEGRPLPVPPARGDWHEPFVDRWKLKLSLFDAVRRAAGRRRPTPGRVLPVLPDRRDAPGRRLRRAADDASRIANSRSPSAREAVRGAIERRAAARDALARGDRRHRLGGGQRPLDAHDRQPAQHGPDRQPAARRGGRDAGRDHVGRRAAADGRRAAAGRAEHPASRTWSTRS